MCGPVSAKRFEHAWTGDYLRAYLISDVGHKRENNEDACLLCVPENEELARRRGYLIAVADGMGGARAGECASHMALSHTTNAHYHNTDAANPDALREAVENANLKVFRQSENDPELSGMGTTISALLVRGEWGYVAQVGDSRVYLKRPGIDLMQITHDHSLVAEQMRCGLITEEEARNHAMKNLITRAVGIKEAVQVDMFRVRLQRGDILILCSDGLSNMVGDKMLHRILGQKDLGAAAQMVVSHALDAGGTDNITAAFLHLTAVPPPIPAEEGALPVKVPAPGFFGRLRRLIG